MKKIAVLSDTHLRFCGESFRFLQRLRDRYFPDADAVLHAGDIVGADNLLAFEGLPVYGVQGNMDPPDASLPLKRIVQVEDKRIALIHGFGSPEGMEDRLLQEFSSQKIDVLVYGHTHYPRCVTMGGVLLFNPGSCTDRRRAPTHTLGILEVGETVQGYHVEIDEE